MMSVTQSKSWSPWKKITYLATSDVQTFNMSNIANARQRLNSVHTHGHLSMAASIFAEDSYGDLATPSIVEQEALS